MNKQTRYWLRRVLFLVMAGLVAFALYQSMNQGKQKGLEEGQSAPDFTLKTLDGKELKLSDLRGKGVLLNFWASWCKPCREEMPAIQSVYEKYRGKGFVVVGVNIAETEVAVQGFTHQLELTFPVVLDRDRKVTRLYQIGPIPSSLFIGPDGKIQRKVSGQMDEGLIEGYIQEILPKNP
jgi:peroxiredoxin